MGKALHVWSSGQQGQQSGNESPIFGGAGTSQAISVEARAQVSIRQGGTFSLHGRTNVSGSGTNSIRFRVGGANGNLTTSGAGTGWLDDWINSDVIAAPPTLINYAYTDTGTNAAYGAVAISFAADSSHVAYLGCSNGSSIPVWDVASSTRFWRFGGSIGLDGITTEANAQLKNRGATSLAGFQGFVSANARVNDSVFKTRINSVDGACTVTFGAGVTGLLVDSSNSDALADGDLYCWSGTLGTGVEDLTLAQVAAAFTNSTSHRNDLVMAPTTFTGADNVAATRAASATEHFFAIGGNDLINSFTTEANCTIKPGFDGRLSHLRIFLSANTYSGSADLNARQNAADGLTTTIGAGVTGWIENTGSFDFVASDDLCGSLVGGTSGSITVQSIMSMITDLTAVTEGPTLPSPGRVVRPLLLR